MDNKEPMRWLIKHKACSEAVKWVGKRSLGKAYKECPNKGWILWASKLLWEKGLLSPECLGAIKNYKSRCKARGGRRTIK